MDFASLRQDEPSLAEDLSQIGDALIRWLQSMGGMITDVGFNMVSNRIETVVQSPDGSRIEFTIEVLSRA